MTSEEYDVDAADIYNDNVEKDHADHRRQLVCEILVQFFKGRR